MSKNPTIIKGRQADKFYPIGFFVSFDQTTGQWKSPSGINTIPEYNSLNVSEPNNFRLTPGISLVFTDLLEDSEVIIKYKRIIYISYDESDSSIKPLESPILFLNRKNH